MTQEKLSVEVWSDYVCPYCYLGKRRFEAGLAQFEHKDDVEIIFKSFELDPYIQVDGNPPVHQMLAEKYGMSMEEAEANTKNITEQAKELDLDFQMATAIRTNTLDAHRLSHFAKSQGKEDEFTERLFKAHFVDSLHIGNHETLADLAEEVGLNRDDVLHVLKGDEYTDDVRADEMRAQEIGVRGVPHFVIGDKYVVRGAHPSETFLGALRKAWEER